jgi:hypothetical protein
MLLIEGISLIKIWGKKYFELGLYLKSIEVCADGTYDNKNL